MTKRYAGWDAAAIEAYEQKRGWDKPGTLSGNSAFEAGRRMARDGVNKMRNQPTEVDGIRFDSKKEAEHYAVLKLRQKAGEISDLQIQHKFRIDINDNHICDYVADFVFRTFDAGMEVLHVQDVKGRRAGTAYQLFRIKAKLLKATFGITVEEI